jgi:glutamate--cysteine ligase
MTLIREEPELERPIEDVADLVAFLRSGEKPREAWRVGTEHEKLGLYADTLEPVPFEGERGIGALLEMLAREHGFDAVSEEGRVIALERDGVSVTLEPGGALEMAGAPLETLHETCREFQGHLALMKHVSARLGIVWLGLGLQPLASIDAMPRMPLDRYRIMRAVLAGRGAHALEMMHMTGGVQANFDYASGEDLALKLRVALAASPLITALYANSCISEGRPNGFESRRAWIWRNTDPDRCGLLPFVFEEDWLEGDAYRRYVEWALDVPMLFIRREGQHVPMQGRTFRDFLTQGHGEHRPVLADWNLHLTTLFPEVRVKRVVEVRGADAVPPGLVCALPALWKGLLYDEEALREAQARLGGWKSAEVDRLHAEVARLGLAAESPGGPAGEVGKDLVGIAAAGLRRAGMKNRSGEDERIFLEPLWEILDRGSSPARHLLERWEGVWRQQVRLLVEYARY